MDVHAPMEIQPQSLLQIRPNLAWESFPDEVVAIDLDRLLYFNLTHAGADTFRCFTAPTTVDQVARHLAPACDAPADEVVAAVLRLANDLAAVNLLVVVPATTAAGPAPANDGAAFPEVKAGAARPLSDFTLHAHGDLQNLLYLDPVHDASEEGWPVRQQ